MKDKNKWLHYLLFFLIMGLGVFLICYVNFRIGIFSVQNKESLWMFFAKYITTIFLGVLIGIEFLVSQINKSGKWRINLAKLTFLGIPSILFTFFNVQIANLNPGLNFLSTNQTFLIFWQIVLGYTLVTSFYKNDSIRF
ncbi:MAG: hypothetical protein RR638_12330 [Carnobacterium sp.]|jgi:hypothetical protein|uniref:Membrane protein n=1 Tax=Carnobacterium maltaromaticum LMA28 TaxID=1234679 RepID=K8E2Y4_CARML|nr:hypothetical protein [Carnobacterium maltaromaticum]AOA01520.1 hypothetical protein BFC23_03030 [Carnobacterium maltaromaticum]KRN60659.1 hypothetical protein IV70_GL000701 [Carnobacterium maltaromaticum DSM 20342]KRN71633.1 hypothetical protein IV76_GL000666 [Carnobacterium maltaromaticum]MBC9808534.1 hypothetical protein [Carnobacterium maltaromaticum]MCI1818966.1 hypothetical protein [Carnobacterium maltaromaticum]